MTFSGKPPSLLRRTTTNLSKKTKKIGRTLSGQTFRDYREDRKEAKKVRKDAIRQEAQDGFLALNRPEGVQQQTPPPAFTPDNLPLTYEDIERELRFKFADSPYAQPAFEDRAVPWWIRELSLNVFDTLGIRPIEAIRGQQVLDNAINLALPHCYHQPIRSGVPPAWEVILAYRWLSASRENILAALRAINRDQEPSWNTRVSPGEPIRNGNPALKLNLPRQKSLGELRKIEPGLENVKPEVLRHWADFGAVFIGKAGQRNYWTYAVQAHLTSEDKLVIQVKDPDINIFGGTPTLTFQGPKNINISQRGNLIVHAKAEVDIHPIFMLHGQVDIPYLKEQVRKLRNHYLY